MSDEKPKKKRKATRPWSADLLHIPGVTDNANLKGTTRLRFLTPKDLEERREAGRDENGVPFYYEPIRKDSSDARKGITGKDGSSVDSLHRVRQDLILCGIPEELAKAVDEDHRDAVLARKRTVGDQANDAARAARIKLGGGIE
jgi:hypothetical protein